MFNLIGRLYRNNGYKGRYWVLILVISKKMKGYPFAQGGDTLLYGNGLLDQGDILSGRSLGALLDVERHSVTLF